MKCGWLVVAAVLLALLALSCAGGSKPAEPDKVVGALLKCTYLEQEYSGEMCQRLLDRVKNNAPDMDIAVSRLNMRYAVTVRTSSGGGYSLEVAATTRVRVGQVWPPGP